MAKYPKLRFGKISGAVSMFNFETEMELKKGKTGEKHTIPKASEYALRLVAIRDGKHFLPMTYSPTFDYINTFVTHAINAPTEDFHPFGDMSSPNSTIRLNKKGSGFKKRRPAPTAPSESTTQYSTKEEEENAARIEEVRKRREARRKESAEREKRRIAEMEQEMANNAVEGVDDEDGPREDIEETDYDEGQTDDEEEYFYKETEDEDDEDSFIEL